MLGALGLALFALPQVSGAAKNRKKANRRAKKKGKKKCRKQDAQCEAVFRELCAPEEDPASCENTFIPCCAFLGTCQATAFLECTFANVA